jgi:hypothetical protein
MNKNKKKIVLIAALFMLLTLVVVMYLLNKSTTEVIRIEFVSDRSLSDQGQTLPSDIRVFCEVFEQQDGDMIYYPELSFRRLGIEGQDKISFSQPITIDLDIDEAKKIYTENIFATQLMFDKRNVDKNQDLGQFTNGVCHFFLLCPGDKRVDNQLYFDNASILKDVIKRKMDKDDLIIEGQRPNFIQIIMLCDSGSGETISNGTETDGTETDDTGTDDTGTDDTETGKEDTGGAGTGGAGKTKKVKVGSFKVTHDVSNKRNVINWDLENAPEDVYYTVQIECDSKCDGNDFSYPTKRTNEASISLDLTASYDKISYRTFRITVIAYDAVGNELKTAVKTGVKLRCM